MKFLRVKPTVFFAALPVVAICVLLSSPADAQSRKGKKPPAKPKIKLPESVRKRTPVAMKVVPVNPSTRRAIQRAAGQLDSFVESKLIDEGQSPNSIASDEVFLRRVYLDVAGRIPTLKEATRFL